MLPYGSVPMWGPLGSGTWGLFHNVVDGFPWTLSSGTGTLEASSRTKCCGLNIHSLRTLERTSRSGGQVRNVSNRTPFGLKDFSPPTHAMGLEDRRPDVGLLRILSRDGGARPLCFGLERRGGRFEAPCDGWHDAWLAARARSSPHSCGLGRVILLFPVARRVRY